MEIDRVMMSVETTVVMYVDTRVAVVKKALKVGRNNLVCHKVNLDIVLKV